MKNKKTIKNIILALVFGILALGVYAVVTGTDSEQINTTSFSSLVGSGNLGQIKESNTDLANAEILRILGSIQNIDLNDDIFKNPVFRELEDSRFAIPKPVIIGRPNPFLPIGFDNLIQQNTNTNSNQIESQNFFDQVVDSTDVQDGESENNFFDQF